ncbi:MAG: DciA family protein [Methylocella sp.]
MRKGNARKTPWSRPLADFVHTAIDPVVARQGFGQSGLILFWDAIVGERLAAISQPVKMQWPARGRDRAADNGAATATLIIRVESGFALEMQHLAPIIIERINAHFGWRSVSRIQLKQGPLAARKPARNVARAPDAAAEAAAEKLVGPVMDEPLRQALTRLGARVLTAP